MTKEKKDSFRVFKVEDSGNMKKLNITEDEIRDNERSNLFDSKDVIIFVRNDLRRIYIWKGLDSHVRKRFISSRLASALQEELMEDVGYNRCKIVSVDAGNEPFEFLNAFGLESTNDKDEGNGNNPFPFIFKPPTPPDDITPLGQPQVLRPIKEEAEFEPYCKHCGSLISEGVTICHVCGKKI